jgi:hypothetical protein
VSRDPVRSPMSHYFAPRLSGVIGLLRPGFRIECGMTGVGLVLPPPGFLPAQE